MCVKFAAVRLVGSQTFLSPILGGSGSRNISGEIAGGGGGGGVIKILETQREMYPPAPVPPPPPNTHTLDNK